ncbi:MAG: PLP-dependent aminotransferase family protein [Candidatus Sericytochromatia bacterium]|nr:PLP-dependent aminotransferase family protein [Candidatus Sericytochromatia bacterium]
MSPFKPSFANRTAHVNPSVIREILKVVSQPDIISFAGGMPAQDLFPFAELEAAAKAAFKSPAHALKALQYGPSEGYQPLREAIAAQLTAEGIDLAGNQILITTGSQQGIMMVAHAFLDPGDTVVVGNPTFLGALQAFGGFEAKFLTVPLDAGGMKMDALARILEHHTPKFIYAIPTFQNPTGLSLQDDRRVELYELARTHGVPVLEDDPYGDLYFGPTRPRAIKSFDHEGGVILLRTFSKVLAPGLRVAYAVVPDAIMNKLLPLKQGNDLHTSAFAQMMVAEFLATGRLEAHLAHLRAEYARRRDLMLAAMDAHFPAWCQWTRPEGGLFIWVTLPNGVLAAPLLEEAVSRQKVAFIPGSAFYPHGGGENTLRLNFSNASEEQIQEGIKRLGAVIRAAAPQLERV